MIDLIIARLKATVPALKLVDGAAGLMAAQQTNPAATPACFVIALGEQPGPNQLADEAVMQTVRSTIGVVFAVRNLGDTRGQAAGTDMESLRQLVKAQLYGWQPSSEFDPLERGSGHLLTFRDGHVWWQDQYVTTYNDRSY